MAASFRRYPWRLGSNDDVRGTESSPMIDDPALDQVMSQCHQPAAQSGLGPWKLVQNPGAFPPPGSHAGSTKHRAGVPLQCSLVQRQPDVAWSLAEDSLPPLPEPQPASARVKSYDGQTAVVEHDGSCVLVLRRTYYPGWVYQVDGGPLRQSSRLTAGFKVSR